MKNKILLLVLLFSVTLLIFLNFRVYKSYVQQFSLLRDINNDTLEFQEFYNEIEINFPNTSVTSMNLKSVKARYLLKENKYDEALDLLNSIKYDPLKMSEAQKARIFLEKGDILNMYKSAKDAWVSLPLNQNHYMWYLKSLSDLKQNEEIINTYNQYKNNTVNIDWHYFYFVAAYNIIDDANKKIIIGQAKEALYLFGNKDVKKLNIILFYIIFGENEYKKSLRFSKIGLEMFSKNDFLGAAENYLNAIKLFSLNPDNNYNRMAALFKLNKHSEILKTYELLPDSINPKNGQFEFLVGRSFLNAKDTIKACEFLNISKNYNFRPSLSYLKNICLN